MELVALDLDGTLVDSVPDIAHCLASALVSLGFEEPGEARTRGWVGDGVETLVARALDHYAGAGRSAAERAALHAGALRVFLGCYAGHLYTRSRLYPHVEATLDLLRDRGLKLACVTNKRYAFAVGLLERAGLRQRFSLILGGDSLAEKKPSPLPLLTAAQELGVAPERAVLVGDSVQDLRAARAAGYSFIWASYGYCAVDAAELGTSPRIAGFDEIAALIAASLPEGACS